MRVEDGYDLTSGATFTDGNNRSTEALDVVEYGSRFNPSARTPRRGILLDCTGDGDAYVLFRDTKQVEIVKWMNLCKVPAIDEP